MKPATLLGALSVFALALIGARAFAISNIVTSSTGGPAADGVLATTLQVVGRQTGIAVSPGLISLGTTDVTVSVPGVQIGDTLLCNLSSGAALTAGVTIGQCTATAANVVTLRFMTPVALGVTVGSFTENIAWLR